MRYNHDASTAPLTIAHPPPLSFNWIAPQQVTTYPAESGGSLFAPTHQFFTPPPPRLGSNSTSSSGMAHALRTTLPQPTLNVREQYTGSVPSHLRADRHNPRSPSFPTAYRSHRLPLSPIPSTSLGYSNHQYGRMTDASYGSGSRPPPTLVPPLGPLVELGSLSYASDAYTAHDPERSKIVLEVHGSIDKGFFYEDDEWTCYRRNYFSCVCYFNMSPYYSNQQIHFAPSGAASSVPVYGFSMCISAVIADNDAHSIELVQHTPKRDKGPIVKPEKQRLAVKQSSGNHLPWEPTAGRYDTSSYQSNGASYPTEYTFERIQFKQATANNGKRRAQQQYYHLVVELYADTGRDTNGSEQWVKVAFRKSARMIVRGRSPGHYQNGQGDRRPSNSSGPSGGGGSIGGGSGYPPNIMSPPDFGGSALLQGSSAYPYDTRSGYNTRHHELTMEPMMSSEDEGTLTDGGRMRYQYYPRTLYETDHGVSGQVPQVEAFPSPRNDVTKVKNEPERSLMYNAGPSYLNQPCGRFEGKAESTGFYLNGPTLT